MSRSAKQWQRRTIGLNGRMINNETAIILTANVIKKQLGLALSKEEKMKEANFVQGKGLR